MRNLAFLVSALALSCSGCGGDDDEACDPPSLTGKAFAQDKGTSTVSGEVTLPSSVPDGRALELFVNDGVASYGVLGASLADQPRSCGPTLSYRIEHLEAGSFKIGAKIQVSAEGHEIVYDHEGWYPGTVDAPLTSPSDGTEVAVADGAAITGIDFGVGPKSP